ncbi:unnamed protein product, partial [Mesorhabditis belari]|uniref:Uncharacterized protein n=1 Tax=Mesorhabditis belari TaxID=2138241 RepID=A0AAF3F2Y0_9BILA
MMLKILILLGSFASIYSIFEKPIEKFSKECAFCSEIPILSDDGTTTGIIDHTRDFDGCHVVSFMCTNHFSPRQAFLYLNHRLLNRRSTISAICRSDGWFVRGISKQEPIESIFCSSQAL